MSEHGGNLRVLAGGTDLIPSMRQKLFEPQYVLDLHGVTPLCGIRPQPDGGVEIGALTTLRAIERSQFLQQHYPVLTEAAATVASPSSATWGRSAATSVSTPAASGTTSRSPGARAVDSALRRWRPLPRCSRRHQVLGGILRRHASSVFCLNAEIEIAAANGTRRIPLRDFYTGLGDNYRNLQSTNWSRTSFSRPNRPITAASTASCGFADRSTTLLPASRS